MKFLVFFVVFITSQLLITKILADAISDEQVWLGVSVTSKVSENSDFFYWFDAGARYGEDYSDLQTTLLRPGIGLKASDTLTLLAGYARFTAHRDGANQNEHRFWQDSTKVLGKFAGGSLIGRSRFEIKYRDTGGTDTGFRLRGRVAWQKLAKNPDLMYVLSNEVFYHMNTTEWGQQRGIDQNRIFVGLKVKLDTKASWSLGYQHDYLVRESALDKELHILASSFSYKW